MKLLRDVGVSLWSWTVITLSAAAFGLLAMLTAWIPPRGRTYLFWARSWARTILFFTGTSLNIESFMGAIMAIGVAVALHVFVPGS